MIVILLQKMFLFSFSTVDAYFCCSLNLETGVTAYYPKNNPTWAEDRRPDNEYDFNFDGVYAERYVPYNP